MVPVAFFILSFVLVKVFSGEGQREICNAPKCAGVSGCRAMKFGICPGLGCKSPTSGKRFQLHRRFLHIVRDGFKRCKSVEKF